MRGYVRRIPNNNKLLVQGKGAFLFIKDTPTPAGIIVLLDMIKNPQNWKNRRIHPEYLTGKVKQFYESVKQIYPFLEKDPLNIQIFKMQLYFALLSENEINPGKALEKFKQFNERINHSSGFDLQLKKTTIDNSQNREFIKFFERSKDKMPQRLFLYLNKEVVADKNIFELTEKYFPPTQENRHKM